MRSKFEILCDDFFSYKNVSIPLQFNEDEDLALLQHCKDNDLNILDLFDSHDYRIINPMINGFNNFTNGLKEYVNEIGKDIEDYYYPFMYNLTNIVKELFRDNQKKYYKIIYEDEGYVEKIIIDYKEYHFDTNSYDFSLDEDMDRLTNDIISLFNIIKEEWIKEKI